MWHYQLERPGVVDGAVAVVVIVVGSVKVVGRVEQDVSGWGSPQNFVWS